MIKPSISKLAPVPLIEKRIETRSSSSSVSSDADKRQPSSFVSKSKAACGRMEDLTTLSSISVSYHDKIGKQTLFKG